MSDNTVIVLFVSGGLMLLLIFFLIVNIGTIKRCTYPVKGVLDHYNEERRTNNRESGVHKTEKYYVSIYKYSVNGAEYTAKGKESTFKYSLPPIGDVREFLVDPKNPKPYKNVTAAHIIANIFAIIFVAAATIFYFKQNG